MDAETTNPARPIAATVTQRIDPACEQAYEAVLAGCNEEAEAFPGFQHREVIKSASGAHLEYHNVIHFDSEANLRKWEHSPERDKWLSRMSSMVVHATPLKVLSGLETWFALAPGEAIVPPPRYKMAIVTWLAIFPLFTALSYAVQPFTEHWPTVLRTLTSSLVLVPVMTYLVMPRMTRVFERWLYPDRAGAARSGTT